MLELGAAGVRRFVFSHLRRRGCARSSMASLTGGLDADVLVAGGVGSLDALRALRDAGVAGVILGEALFSGRLDLGEAAASSRLSRPRRCPPWPLSRLCYEIFNHAACI